MKRILIVFLIALVISFLMFLIKEQPFKIVPKEKIPQEIEEHEHEPGTLPHGH